MRRQPIIDEQTSSVTIRGTIKRGQHGFIRDEEALSFISKFECCLSCNRVVEEEKEEAGVSLRGRLTCCWLDLEVTEDDKESTPVGSKWEEEGEADDVDAMDE